MKRLAISFLASVCGLLLSATAHASYVERRFLDEPAWNAGEIANEENDGHAENGSDEPRGFNETDDEDAEPTFDPNVRLPELNLSGGASITRAEFTAMLVRSLYGEASIRWCYWDVTSVHPPRFELLFRDVPVDHPQAPEICVAMRDGLVRGYGNDVFRPDDRITFADAAKIVARSHGLTPWADPSVPEHWFDPYVEALGRRNAIPSTIVSLEERITAGEAREILERLAENDRGRPSRTAAELIAAWERKYERPTPPPPVRTAPRATTPRPSTPSQPSRPAQSGSASSVRPASSAAAQQSSRPKAWYEF